MHRLNNLRASFLLRLAFPIILMIAGCERTPEQSGGPEVIRLDQLQSLPALEERTPLEFFRVAVAAVLSPEGTATLYRPLIDYLGKAVDRPVQLIQRRNYQEVNDLLSRGSVDVAFVCTGAYWVAKDLMTLLVVPRINGENTYRSYLIVHASSPVNSMEELRGKVFAFVDPISNTGYFHPLSMLREMNEQPESFFSKAIFTYSHDRSIQAVAHGLVDGASVDHLVYLHALRRDGETRSHTRVIDVSREYGIPPVVVPARTEPWKIAKLKELFLGIHETEQGREALRALDIEKFEEPDPALYQ